MSITTFRKSDHATEPLFVSRWSSRVLTGEPVPDDVLFSSFEAARWAPSGGNAQPWRFIYAKRESANWPALHGLLNARNQVWAANASALVVVLSRRTRDSPEGPKPLRSHSFDAGAAWSNFAHQASLLGWSTRAIGGFDYPKTRETLAIPDDFEIEVFVALGRAVRPAAPATNDDASERPSDRLPIASLIADGRFAFA